MATNAPKRSLSPGSSYRLKSSRSYQFPLDLANRLRRVQLPKASALIIYAIGATVASRMCVWQLRRSKEKQELLDKRREALYHGSGVLPWMNPKSPPSVWDVVRLLGWYDEPRSVYSSPCKPPPHVQTGGVEIPGHYVYTPFHTTNGQVVLVNRGWLPHTLVRPQLEHPLPLRSNAPTPNAAYYAAQLASYSAAVAKRSEVLSSSTWRVVARSLLPSRLSSFAEWGAPTVSSPTVPPPLEIRTVPAPQSATAKLARWAGRVGLTPLTSATAGCTDARGVLNVRDVSRSAAAQYRMQAAIRPRKVLFETSGLPSARLETAVDALRSRVYAGPPEDAPTPPPDAPFPPPPLAGVLRAVPSPIDEPKAAPTAQFPLLDYNLHVFEDDDDDTRIGTLRVMSQGRWDPSRTDPLPKASVDFLTHAIMPTTHLNYAKFWAACVFMPILGWAMLRGVAPKVNAPFYAKSQGAFTRYKSAGRTHAT